MTNSIDKIPLNALSALQDVRELDPAVEARARGDLQGCDQVPASEIGPAPAVEPDAQNMLALSPGTGITSFGTLPAAESRLPSLVELDALAESIVRPLLERQLG